MKKGAKPRRDQIMNTRPVHSFRRVQIPPIRTPEVSHGSCMAELRQKRMTFHNEGLP
ncbi:hypothetical protein PM082_024492 [Marasmius tenuissimus]|nr:hypothetical protein PM082_024492 [Marasmius tenuissimus]